MRWLSMEKHLAYTISLIYPCPASSLVSWRAPNYQILSLSPPATKSSMCIKRFWLRAGRILEIFTNRALSGFTAIDMFDQIKGLRNHQHKLLEAMLKTEHTAILMVFKQLVDVIRNDNIFA